MKKGLSKYKLRRAPQYRKQVEFIMSFMYDHDDPTRLDTVEYIFHKMLNDFTTLEIGAHTRFHNELNHLAQFGKLEPSKLLEAKIIRFYEQKFGISFYRE